MALKLLECSCISDVLLNTRYSVQPIYWRKTEKCAFFMESYVICICMHACVCAFTEKRGSGQLLCEIINFLISIHRLTINRNNMQHIKRLISSYVIEKPCEHSLCHLQSLLNILLYKYRVRYYIVYVSR